MTTTCTSLNVRPEGSGSSGISGRDESPFLPAGNPIPGEVGTVVCDAVNPRDHCEEDASLPSEKKKEKDGLNSTFKKTESQL